MRNQSYNEQIKNSEDILVGVKEHQDELIEKGYTKSSGSGLSLTHCCNAAGCPRTQGEQN